MLKRVAALALLALLCLTLVASDMMIQRAVDACTTYSLECNDARMLTVCGDELDKFVGSVGATNANRYHAYIRLAACYRSADAVRFWTEAMCCALRWFNMIVMTASLVYAGVALARPHS